jgi:hypothetical protein
LDRSRQAQGLQGKHVDEFDEADFEEAIRKFEEGTRPFDPRRLIFGVAIPADRHQLITVLDEAEHRLGIKLELYDAIRLDEILRSHPRIVIEFFGRTAAARFCTAPIPDAESLPDFQDRTVRALMAGPLRALGLRDEELRINALEDPGDRAEGLLGLAASLSESGWNPHARALRGQARSVLRASIQAYPARLDHAERLARLAIDEIVSAVLVGDATAMRSPLSELSTLIGGRDLPPDFPGSGPGLEGFPQLELWRSRVGALDAGADALQEPFAGFTGSIDELGRHLGDLLDAGDLHAAHLGIVFGELAVAADAGTLVLPYADRLSPLADVLLGGTQVHRRHGARLACVIADVRSTWDSLADRAHRWDLDEGDAALVLARCARWHALNGHPAEAEAAWSDAVERAGHARLYFDAAAWMRSIVRLRFRYGPVDGRVEQLLATATAISDRPDGDRLLPDISGEWQTGLGAQAELHPDPRKALGPLIRVRWASVVTGDLNHEMEAAARLGDLLAQAGEPDAALGQYVRAHAHDKAQNLIRSHVDRPLLVTAHLARPVPAERATVYFAAAADADLLPDDDVDRLGAAAVDDLQGRLDGSVVDGGFFAPDLLRGAAEALAAAASRLPDRSASSHRCSSTTPRSGTWTTRLDG